MRIMLLSFIAMLFTFVAVGQNETSSNTSNTWIGHPDVVIKGDELKNFAGGQLSEMLIGRLPGIDHINTMTQEFQVVFIVDGFVWESIDAININNVEEIAYYRGGLNVKLGVQNQRPNGVIVITTKTAKFKQPLSVEVNTILGGNFYKEDLANKKHRVFQSYNVVLSQGLDKFSWRASAVYNNATRNLTGYDFTRQFQLNGDLRYSPLSWLDLGLNINYAPGRGDLERNQAFNAQFYSTSIKTDVELNNWNGTFYVQVKPIKGLVNEIRVQKSRIGTDMESDAVITNTIENINYGMLYYSKDLSVFRYNALSFQDDLSYRFSVNGDKIRFKAGAIFQYNDLKAKENIDQRNYSAQIGDANPNVNFYGYKGEAEAKYYTLAGDFTVNFYDILSLQAGVRSDKYKNAMAKAMYAPFYYADLNLKEALLKEVTEVNEIRLFGSYGEYRSAIKYNNESSSGVFATGLSFVDANFNDNLDKMKTRNFGLKTRFFDRLSLAADIYENDNYAFINMGALPNPPNIGSISTFSMKYSGWRIWGSADVFKNSALRWNAGLNVFKNEEELGSLPGSQLTLNVDDFKPATQAGMQHSFSYANFALNLSGSAYFNQSIFDLNLAGSQVDMKTKQATFINLNYLSFGYSFKDQVAGKKIKDLNVSIVGRNLVQDKQHVSDNVLSKTIGIALNASF